MSEHFLLELFQCVRECTYFSLCSSCRLSSFSIETPSNAFDLSGIYLFAVSVRVWNGRPRLLLERGGGGRFEGVSYVGIRIVVQSVGGFAEEGGGASAPGD